MKQWAYKRRFQTNKNLKSVDLWGGYYMDVTNSVGGFIVRIRSVRSVRSRHQSKKKAE